MMKRWLTIVVACMLALSGCGGSVSEPPAEAPKDPPVISEPLPTAPDADSAELAAVRAEITKSGALMAVAYLGYAQLPFFSDISVYLEANGFGDVYPFLMDVPEEGLARQEGGELYAVVPESDDVELTVYEYIMDETDDYIPDPGAQLLKVSGGEPILLIGNVSEIVPNLFIRAEKKDGSVVEYAPCLSMMDGALNACEGVYDFTPSQLLPQFWPEYDPVPDEIFCGTWYAQEWNNGDELMAMTLTLENDGRAEYFYGYPYGEILEWFEGSWSLNSEDQIELEMFGGPVSWEGSETSGESYEWKTVLSWDFNSSALVLSHESGSPLLYGTDGIEYSFLNFDGFYLVGDWIADTQYRDWVYELRLFDNAECWFNVYETDGDFLAGYEGWWFVENDLINLSLLLCDGEHPENSELDYMWGEYLTVMSDPEHLTMQFSQGSILTLDMEESGEETFARRG